MNRRQFLGAFGVGAAALSTSTLTRALVALPTGALAPSAQTMNPAAHAIHRLTYGVTPDLYTYVRQIGPETFIAQQLNPAVLDDSALTPRLAEWQPILDDSAGSLFERYEDMRRPVMFALMGGTTVRALYSQRQLFERVVYFFGNHFHIYIDKGVALFLKIDDDRDVIRANAMTNFRTLLGASARSPAMLAYLDNAQSNKRRPNENYSRELLELHTLGVHGGYTETDVKEVARAFTGWSMRAPREGGDIFTYFFRRTAHDDDAKTVLGTTIPAGGGESDGEIVLDLLASHPSTARFISEKLARRFVSDAPPESLVSALAETFTATQGDVTSLLRTLFASAEFWSAPPKLKHPFEYLVSILRALAFDITDSERFMLSIRRMLEGLGNLPFSWQAPNGYPDVTGAWKDALLLRWRVAAAAAGALPGGQATPERLVELMEQNHIPLQADAVIAFLGDYLLGRSLTGDELAIVMDFAHGSGDTVEVQVASALALLFASPAFQYR